MSDQPTTAFAKAHSHAVDMFRRVNEIVDDIEYGPMPDYKTNRDGWTARIRSRMAPKIMHRTGLKPRDINLNVILSDILVKLEEQGDMGDTDMAFKVCHRETRAYIHRKRESRDENRRAAAQLALDRAELFEYGHSLSMTDSEISSQMVQIHHGLNYVPRCKIAIKSYRNTHPLVEVPKDPTLDEWFEAKEDRNVDDELTQKDDWSGFWTSVRNLSLGVVEQDQLHSYVHRFFGDVASVKNTGKNKGQMLTELKKHFDAVKAGTENALSGEAPEQPGTPTPGVPIPDTLNESASTPVLRSENSNLKGIVDMPESPIVVYPMQNGSINYKGIRFSVTLRLGGTFDMAIALMDQFAAHIDLIDPTCLIRAAAPTLVPPTAQPASPAPQSAPAQTGAKPVLSEQVVKIVREADPKSKLVYTGLYTLFGNAPGKFARYKVKDTDRTLAALNSATGMDWSQAPLFTEQAVNLTALYRESDKTDGGGKPYHDLVDVQGAQAKSA